MEALKDDNTMTHNKVKTIQAVLIANRGEIASRVIRTCKKMGIRTIALYSEVDKDLPYVGEASTSVNVGGPALATSYLDQDLIVSIAKIHGADAIHPGYGFLSENAGFAEKCQNEGIMFIGPNAYAIEAMGSKSKAKTIMQDHGVPTIPGYQGEDQSADRLKKEAVSMGFPVLLKAAAGGGGKGMRIIHEEKELDAGIQGAKREAQSAFGHDELIIEKYIARGRHIEFQIFGDQHGNVVHILERECSIQRRYQKVVEESPSPIMTDELRKKMGDSAVAAAAALKYDNAGTVEFIYDEVTGDYYFLEVNTRLQVEHPVTEEVTGLDLVQMQIESAQGLPLSITQDDIKGSGYAIEARLYAEDPSNNFLPVAGKISNWQLPDVEGLRVETAITTGSEISIFYDPMIAKLIVWDRDRVTALRKMHYVLQHLVCHGITTNQDFLRHLVKQDLFLQGKYDTHFIDEHIDLEKLTSEVAPEVLMAATVFDWSDRKQKRTLLQGLPTGWRNNFVYPQSQVYIVGDKEFAVAYRDLDQHLEMSVEEVVDAKEEEERQDSTIHIVRFISSSSNSISIEIDRVRHHFIISTEENKYVVQHEKLGSASFATKDRFPAYGEDEGEGGYITPMPSQIIKVLVSKGDAITKGQDLVILSSMKMENTISALEDGVVEDTYVSDGDSVEAGVILLKTTET